MLSKIYSVATIGLQCIKVVSEVDITRGLSSFSVVGLGDTAVQEAKERVRSAIKNSGYKFPNTRVTANLAPADIRKKGPIYDLALSIGILISSGQLDIEQSLLNESIFIGELALDGCLRHIAGALGIAIYAKEKGFKKLFLPKCDAGEASQIGGISIYPLTNLQDFINMIEGKKEIKPLPILNTNNKTDLYSDSLDFKHIKGQEKVKRSLEVAAAGGHNILILCLKTTSFGNLNNSPLTKAVLCI